jgi:hypothetical protein
MDGKEEPTPGIHILDLVATDWFLSRQMTFEV